MIRIPAFVRDDQSTLGLVKQITDNFRVAFLGKITAFDEEKQTVDISPVVSEPTYLPDGSVDNIPWPDLSGVPVVTTGFGPWCITFPVKIGSTALILCTDLNFREWYKRDQNINMSSEEYHSLNNAIALTGINSSQTLIPNYLTDGISIRNTEGQLSIDITESGIQAKVGGKMTLDITGENVNINIGGTTIATITQSGITMDSVDITIQGTKIFEWLTTHTHGYVSPSGPAITDPAGPQ